MLELCTALALAEDSVWVDAIFDLCEAAGFGECRRYHSPDDVTGFRRTTPPVLFLCDKLGPEVASRALAGVRQHPVMELRFTPIIMITTDRTETSILRYIQTGYDDIIVYPCEPEAAATRVLGQFNQMQNYYQTETYFGPDRRRNQANPYEGGKRGRGEYFYRHFVINRQFRFGTKIVSTETFLPGQVNVLRA